MQNVTRSFGNGEHRNIRANPRHPWASVSRGYFVVEKVGVAVDLWLCGSVPMVLSGHDSVRVVIAPAGRAVIAPRD